MNILEISAVSEQTVPENGYIVFDVTDLKRGCAIKHVDDSNNVTITYPGVYSIFFSADIVPTEAEEITVTLENNGIAIASTVFTGVLNVQKRISFMKAIEILNSCKCINNTANIKVKVSSAVTVSNAVLLIDRKNG